MSELRCSIRRPFLGVRHRIPTDGTQQAVPIDFDPPLHTAYRNVTGVVEEALRLRAPVQMNTRILTEHLTTDDGTEIPSGARTMAVIGSANVDERVFADPTVVDVRRGNAARHLSFGGGLHHCLGAPLARVQLQETVTALVRRFRGIELTGPSDRYPSLIFPSLSTLPVRMCS